MRDLRKILILIIGSLGLTISAFSADVRMSVEPTLIGLLDRAVLKIEFIDTKGDAVDIPKAEGLNIQYQGQNSETRIVNLKSNSKVVHTYLVTPTKVGDYTIGPVTCTYNGGQKEVSTQLRVIKPENDQETQKISEVMFSRITTDREAPYVHEPFGLDVKVYIRDGVQIDGNFSLRGGIPESGMDGDLQWEVTGRDREDLNGTIFNVYTLHTTAETLTAGTFIFRPEVQVNIVIPRQKSRPYGFDDPFWGDFFGRQERRPIILDCNTLKINVRPVPMKNRPASYTGGVGLFDLDVTVGPKQIKAGEPITIKMRISGNGNLSQIIPPTLNESNDLKLYKVHALPDTPPEEARFEQVVIPKSDRVIEIPAISFSYFNTKTEDFRTITKGPFPITVDVTENQTAQVIASVLVTTKPETEILGHDIIYLKPAPVIWKNASTTEWFRTKLFYITLTLPALLLLGIAGLTTKRNALANDIARARRQKAPKAARKNVQRAEHALRENDDRSFYEAMWNALTEYFGHRLNLAPGEVSRAVVLAHIPQEKETIASLFNTIEQRRYGSHIDREKPKDEMRTLLNQLTTTLKKCERIKT